MLLALRTNYADRIGQRKWTVLSESRIAARMSDDWVGLRLEGCDGQALERLLHNGGRGLSALNQLVAGLTALALGAGSAAAADSAVRSIDVRSIGEGYVADLVLWTPVSNQLAFDVLVDFEHVAGWTPTIRESRVLKREANRATVEYSGSVRAGAVTVPFMTVRDVEFSAPSVIVSTQVKGTMRRHRSRISLAPEGTGTRLDYHLEMEPSAIAAVLLSTARIERELRETFDAAAGEMLRRQSAAALAGR